MKRTAQLSLFVALSLSLAAPVRAQTELLKSGGPGTGTGSRVALDDGVALVFSNGPRLVDALSGEMLHFLVGMGGSTDEYVASFAIDGGLAAVGRPTFQSTTATGAAYVFDVASGQQLARLTPPGGTIDSRFGWSIDIQGGRVLVGARGEDQVGDDAGAAYLFDAQTGQFLRQFLPPTGAARQHFGESVALQGDVALIGACGAPFSNPVQAAAAYLFDVNTGQLLHTLQPPTPTEVYFGLSVALSPTAAAVSSLAQFSIGHVHVFDVASGAVLHDLTAPAPLGNDQFGAELDVDGERLIAGATQHSNVGDAYVLDLQSGGLLYHLTPSDGGLNDFFGSGVAVDGNFALAGAPGNFNGTNDAGATYLFALEDLGQSLCPQAPNSTGSASRLAVAGSPSLGDGLVDLRADAIPNNQPGIFFAGTGRVQLPLGNGVRCAGGGVVRLSRPMFSMGGVLRGRVDFARGGASLSPGTIYFQCWYRDNAAGGAASDVSDCVEVDFTP